MNRKLLIRKLVYLSLMLPTILGLYLMGHPSTTKALGGQGSAGGLLARQRDRHRISQANLGEIDPTGEAMKLAAFGLRGPAATILWHQVHQQKMREDWTKASATALEASALCFKKSRLESCLAIVYISIKRKRVNNSDKTTA